jgi:pSer/pThr/pTyr-binding forkhead associated (FHA) protein
MGVRLSVRPLWTSEAGAELVYEFDQERIVIGRQRGADVHVPHPAVSGHHATLRVQGASWVLADEGSTNGTYVNSVRLPPGRPKVIRSGDIVHLGGFALEIAIGVPVVEATGIDKTAALARRIVRDVLAGSASLGPTRLVVLNGPSTGQSVDVPLPPARLVVGRGETCDLFLSDADLSREHAEVRADLDGVILRDLGSKNGTRVNDRPVVERRLRDGDELRFGRTVVLFEDPMEARIGEISDAPEAEVETPSPSPPAEPEPTPPPAPPEAAATVAEATSRGATPETAAAPARAPRGHRRSLLSADIVIYILAGAVLLLSIAGLVVLLR